MANTEYVRVAVTTEINYHVVYEQFKHEYDTFRWQAIFSLVLIVD